MKTIDLTELEHWADDERSFALMDVLPETAAHGHPPASPPVLGFLDQISKLNIEKGNPVILYENNSAAVYTDEAEGMLQEAGFSNVYHFVGPHSELHPSAHTAEGH